jgi:3-oxoacyl-[acyl-carrier protein] reductase
MIAPDSPLLSLAGEIAIVTGGSGGLGRAICQFLARAGAFVAVNFRSDEGRAHSTLELVRQEGGEGKLLRFDVADPAAVDRGVAELLAEKGRVDILVNNAGIGRDGLIGRMKEEDWQAVISTGLTGAFHLCRSVSKNMIRNRKGRIVNIASTAGEAGNAGQVNYSSAKAGLIGLTRALARELAPRNILVNCVSPGIIAGGMSAALTDDQMETIRSHVPLRRTGNPEDVAAAVLFLCSGMSAYVTGQVLRVNGGLYI